MNSLIKDKGDTHQCKRSQAAY